MTFAKILTVATFIGLGSAAAAAADFSFVALGDMPYGKPEEVNPRYEALIGAVNARKPAFTIHIGDTKSGSTPCDNAMLDKQLSYLNSFAPAAIYTPGDNEWTDCHRKKAGEFDPLERLDYIRKTYFAKPQQSFGATPFAVESQSVAMKDAYATYAENTRFIKDGVMFVQAHVVGSNNNLEARDMKAAQEFFARDAANVAWLGDTFDKALAANAAALVVSIQADMFEFDWNPSFEPETFLRHSGYANFGAELVKRASAFKKPVLLVYGDSHIFRAWRPFPNTAANITALEVFGDKDMHAVEVLVTPSKAEVFGFRPVYNPAPAASQ